jgi:hypothetical protein
MRRPQPGQADFAPASGLGKYGFEKYFHNFKYEK